MNYLFFSIFCGFLSLGYGWFLISRVLKKSRGDEKIQAIALAIEEGAKSFLKRQYQSLFYTGLILFILISYFLGVKLGTGFLIGAGASALAGYIGMMVSVKTNLRVTTAAKNSLNESFKIAFSGGAVTGFMVTGLGLLSLSLFYLLGNDLRSLVALGFGASLVSVFGRLGGGIYTKAADVGADLVGKMELEIPEDDPRNPAVIADNVGDNVGDCAGMAADLFETYVVTIIASMIIGNTLFSGNENIILFPLLLADLGVISFIISTFFANTKNEKLIMRSLYRVLIIDIIISTGFYYFLTEKIFNNSPLSSQAVYLSLIIGFIITLTIVGITEYYTSKKFRPVKSIAQSSGSGPATNIITGLSVSLESTFLPVIIMVLGMIFGFKFLGLYGIALATMSMLSLAGVIIAIDSFGPITDNAGGLSEMSQAPPEVRKITDALDSVGNTTKAVTKGYAIVSAGLSALVLFSSYVEELKLLKAEIFEFDLKDPYVLIGLFLGASLPYLFSSLAMRSVGRAASSVVEEVRRQFKDGEIIKGTKKPDYSHTVDIVTRAALKEMIWPSLLPLIFTIFVGFIFGPVVLGGFLIGTIVAGVFVAISMTIGGGAWDNAKKYIEEGNYGGKGSESHKAAIIGDTVGDPYKDTAGPAINPMIKVVNIIALLIVSFIV